MDIHILDVGCGGMAILLNPDGTRIVMDCNLTDEKKDDVSAYAERILGRGNSIDVFINTHRDADHMRGITDLHGQHTIRQIRDPDVPGTTTDSPEYKAYMRLRQSVGAVTIVGYENRTTIRRTAVELHVSQKRDLSGLADVCCSILHSDLFLSFVA